jgi:tripartite-type tricarboxylate transporter receptor subunit TctC
MTMLHRMIVAASAVFAVSTLANAQPFPAKPIHIVVPFVPGGGVDAFGRLLAGKLQERFKQSVIIDNRGGAGGNVGANFVAKAPADGYTILLHTNGQAISPATYKSLPYDPVSDFVRIGQLTSTSTALVANNDVPIKNFQEFVAYAKARPGKLNYGSSGVGNNLHLTMEMIKRAAGIDLQMVPFNGDAPLYTAVMAGEVPFALGPTTFGRAHIESGAIRALGVTTAKRVSTLPNTPTIAEQGLPGFSANGWLALFAPAATPRDIVDRIYREAAAIVSDPEMQTALANLTLDAALAGPDEFDKIYRDDVARYKQVVKDANIPMQE